MHVRKSKALAIVLAGVLAASAVGTFALAQDPQEYKVVNPVYGATFEGDGYVTGSKVPDGFAWGKIKEGAADYFSAQVVAANGGQGVKLSVSDTTKAKPDTIFSFGKGGTKTCYVPQGAKGIVDTTNNGLLFYIDTTGYVDDASFDAMTYVMFTEENPGVAAPQNKPLYLSKENAPYYMQDTNGKFTVSGSITGANCLKFPAAYKGYIAIPLSSFKNSGWAGQDDGKFYLQNVTEFAFNNKYAANSSLTLDNIGFYGPELTPKVTNPLFGATFEGDDYTVGSKVPDGFAWGKVSGAADETGFSAKVVAANGGKALEVGAVDASKEYKADTIFSFGKGGTRTKYVPEGAKGIVDTENNGLIFYVDTTGFKGTDYTYVMFTEESFGAETAGQKPLYLSKANAPYYLQDTTGAFTNTQAINGANYFYFPKDYKGYVAIPLSSFKNSGWAGKDDGKFYLQNVTELAFNNSYQANSKLVIDNIGFYGPEILKVYHVENPVYGATFEGDSYVVGNPVPEKFAWGKANKVEDPGFSAKVVAAGGGKALEVGALDASKEYKADTIFTFGRGGTKTNYVPADAGAIADTGKNGLIFYVDTTGFKGTDYTYVMFTEESFGAETTGQKPMYLSKENAPYYLQDATGAFTNVQTVNGANYFYFPKDYKGYVAIPLSSFKNSGWAGKDDGKFYLKNVTELAFNNSYQANSKLVIDDIGFYGPELEAATPPEPSTTEPATSNEPTTAPPVTSAPEITSTPENPGKDNPDYTKQMITAFGFDTSAFIAGEQAPSAYCEVAGTDKDQIGVSFDGIITERGSEKAFAYLMSAEASVNWTFKCDTATGGTKFLADGKSISAASTDSGILFYIDSTQYTGSEYNLLLQFFFEETNANGENMRWGFAGGSPAFAQDENGDFTVPWEITTSGYLLPKLDYKGYVAIPFSAMKVIEWASGDAEYNQFDLQDIKNFILYKGSAGDVGQIIYDNFGFYGPDFKSEEETTTPPEVTSTPVEVTSTPEETTTPPEETSTPVEVTSTPKDPITPPEEESTEQPSVPIETLIDEENAVVVMGDFGGGATLKTVVLTEGDAYNAAKTALDKVASQFKLYDINVLKDGQKVQPNGSAFVGVPVPEGFDTSKLAVYRMEEDGTLASLAFTIQDGVVVFETTHFSVFAVAQVLDTPSEIVTTPASSDNSTPNVDTGSSGIGGMASALAIAAISLAAAVCFKKK